MFLVFAIFQLSLWAERRVLIRELTEEAEQGLIPADHIDPLCSYFGRTSTRFLPEGAPEDAYIKTATTLAMRKHQVRQCPPAKKESYRNDIERLRREISGLLALSTLPPREDAWPPMPADVPTKDTRGRNV